MTYHEPWNIHTRAHHCAQTQQPFQPQQPILTALFPSTDPNQPYTRLDFSEQGWLARPSNAPKPFSHWRSQYRPPIPQNKPQTQLHQQSPDQFLAHLITENNPQTENLRYVLALTLERKKILRQLSTHQLPNGILRLYLHTKTQQTIPILDPNLTLDQLTSLQLQIISLLPS